MALTLAILIFVTIALAVFAFGAAAYAPFVGHWVPVAFA